MDFDFESQYADELDALRDLDEDEIYSAGPVPKTKKSLDFSTPSTKQKSNQTGDPNDSLITPLEIDEDELSIDEPKAKNVKRKCDDLFKELSDDETEEAALENQFILPSLEPKTKRQKTWGTGGSGNDYDDDITPPPSPPDKISVMEGGQKKNYVEKAISRINKYKTENSWSRPRVLRHVPDSDFMSTRGLNGKYVYMKLRDNEELDREVDDATRMGETKGMLGTSIRDLKAQVEEKLSKQLLEESRMTEFYDRTGIDDVEDTDGDIIECDTDSNDQDGELWVQQYTPRMYTELLSDEGTNKTLLRWLKLWDHLVYGKERKKKVKKEVKKEKNGFQNRHAPDVEEELDAQGRPQQKVVLMCGPPGLGKTTLAHIVAKHAGYNVVEMNASDDRSVDVFKTRIEAATQMKAVMGADPRPNCLVIDEIDGAPQPAINMLLSVIKRQDPKRVNNPATKKKKKEGDLLRRPIICICNDLYTPSLRPLRQCALVIHFPPTVSSKLAGRLMEISKKERLKTDLSTLLALCEKSDNDIRSCLNTLQFAKAENKELRLQLVQSMNVGQKDVHKSLFSVWQHIFKMPKPKMKRYVNPHDRAKMNLASADYAAFDQNNTSLQSRFHSSLNMVQAAGEYEKVMQGLHENYLTAKVKDPHLHTLGIASEWLCFVDMINTEIAHTQNYTIGRYLPYLSVSFHLMFASNAPNKITYPHSQYEMSVNQGKMNSLVSTMMTEMVPSARKHMNTLVTVTEFVPPLMDVIQPTLRPVNTQLYSSREKEDLNKLIKIMIAYNITYRQERTIEGQYVYVLDPGIDELMKFTGVKVHKQLTYAAKQLISREIELEKMRRSEGKIDVKESKPKPQNVQKDIPDELPTHKRQTLQPKPIIVKEEDQPLQDFFGRAIKPKKNEENKPAEEKKKEVGLNTEIWFHFKEGYTNAVRKTVKIQDLL